MIGKIAVSAANFAIDKPYSYWIPRDMTLAPGQRVTVPFGRGNRRAEGVVLSVEEGSREGLKTVEAVLDETPLLSPLQLRLAAFLRERYFCTFYDACRAILPAGLWFDTKAVYSLTDNREWKEKTIRKPGAAEILRLMEELGGGAREPELEALGLARETLEDALRYLAGKKWIAAQTEYLRRGRDKTEKIATLTASAEEAREYAQRAPKQRAVLEMLSNLGQVSVKELCYFTGATPAAVRRLEEKGFVALTDRPVLRCREIVPAPLEGPLVLNEEQESCYKWLRTRR